MVERVVLVAALKPGGRDRALDLLATRAADEEPDPVTDRQGVFLSDRDVIFFIEGPGAAAAVHDVLNDPVRSTMIAPWLPLLDGPLHAAHEAYFFERGDM